MSKRPPTMGEQFTEGIEGLPPEPSNLPAFYRAAYRSGTGLDVLVSHLEALGAFNWIRDEEERHLHNYAIDVLNTLGVLERDNHGRITNMRQIVQALTNLAEPRKEKP